MAYLFRWIFGNPRMLIRFTIFSFALVIISLVIGGGLLVLSFATALEEEMGSRALAIARTLAQMPEIREKVGQPGGENVIQPIAERTRLATNVDYVVVIDMEKRRYSHPLAELIGEKFSGGDEGPALADHEYTSRARGVLGPSVRAFVPIKDEEGRQQLGVVVVGVITPTLTKLVYHFRERLYWSLLAATFVGFLGSYYLARNIKRTMFNLEPAEIARLLEERVAVFQAMSEGVIAIDRENRITIMNEEAKRILGLSGNPIGRSIKEVLPDARLPEVVATGMPVFNQERLINNTSIISNRVPIKVKGEIVGAVATFKDKTEVQKLAEELTGVKRFVEALRAQSHEYFNQLHTIAGLIQLGKHEEAVEFIFDATEEQEEISRFLINNIKDSSVAGLLLGKYNRARELKIEMTVDRSSRLTRLPRRVDSASLVVVIGNLLDNAMEAVRGLGPDSRRIACSIRELQDGLEVEVSDRGPGISLELREKIFEAGFSTKGGENAGFGLSLVRNVVSASGGTLHLESQPDLGSRFTALFPWNGPRRKNNSEGHFAVEGV